MPSDVQNMALAFVSRKTGRLPQTVVDQALLLESLDLLGAVNSGGSEWKTWTRIQLGLDSGLGVSSAQVLPEDRFDRQPLTAPDGSFVLVADLRLDNRPELIALLGLPAADQLADSDILLAAWLRWREACLDYMSGPFAFAVWEPAQRILFAARDHLGGRPLFYHHTSDFFALASTQSALLRLPELQGTLNRTTAIDSLLVLPVPRSETFFTEITRLPPGHWLRLTPAGLDVRSYWQPSDARPVRFAHDRDYADGLRDVFDEIMKACLRSTTPIACELSAGLDSSTVVATAAHLLGPDGGPLHAFTSVPRPGFQTFTKARRLVSEGPAAAELAAFCPNVTHHQIDSRGFSLVEEWRRWAAAQGEPPFNPVNYLWTTAIRAQARAFGARVLLTGAKGNGALSFDTLFGFRELFRQGRWPSLLSTARSLRRRSETSGRRTLWYALNGLLPPDMLRRMRGAEWPTLSAPNLDYTLIRPEYSTADGRLERLLVSDDPDPPSLAAQRDFFWQTIDNATSRTATLLLHDIDERDPTADRRLWEYVYGLPPEQFIVGGETRSVLRRAVAGRMPESTRLRYDHGLQGMDWHVIVEQARPALMAEIDRVEESALVRELIDCDRARWLLEHWPEGNFGTPAVHTPWHMALTRGLSMASFLRDFDPALAR